MHWAENPAQLGIIPRNCGKELLLAELGFLVRKQSWNEFVLEEVIEHPVEVNIHVGEVLVTPQVLLRRGIIYLELCMDLVCFRPQCQTVILVE
jgi:hypothetical protein